MGLFATGFLLLYFFVLLLLAVFGTHRYLLTYLYYRHRKNVPREVPAFEKLPNIPFVTVQLPIYNEKYVIERIIQKACKLNYPREKFEIQVLDDSTDETQQIARAAVRRYQKKGIQISYLHRTTRTGFKAGALGEGLKSARGEFIAVFDADFLPSPEFLKKMIPYFFCRQRYGMVQARWGHINQDYSLMTQAQSILLDGHFVIEHTARNRSGRFFNFNGTAGIWSRRCLEEAGGWEYDTLTEDLDISYRAQLKGWKFLYVPEVVVPAELPVDMNGLKCQQHRWSKGSIQTAKKLIPRIFKSSLPLGVKFEAIFHLLNNLAYVLMIVLAFLMPFAVVLRHQAELIQFLWIDLPVFVLATLSVGVFYVCSQREAYSDWKSRLIYLPLNLTMGIGLSVNNTKAVLEAVINKQGEFARTAKYAIAKKSDVWQNKKYKTQIGLVTFFELFLGFYFTAAVVYALANGLWISLYCLILFQIGFLYVGLLSLVQGRTDLGLAANFEPSTIPAE